MFLDPERPLLLIDDGQEMFLAVNRALDRLGAWRPVMLIPQYDAAVHYIADSVRAGRPPAAIVIRTPDSDDARLALLEWVRHQPEPTRSIQILVMTDEAIDGCADGLDACLEETLGQMFRHGDATRV